MSSSNSLDNLCTASHREAVFLLPRFAERGTFCPTNMLSELISRIEALIPGPTYSPADLEQKYPIRNLPAGAMVTRIAPSPTGFMHIGTVYMALVNERLAHQSSGIFYLRIEDTDKKREVQGATGLIVNCLQRYGMRVDEGEVAQDVEVGNYGPYKQSERANIYKSYIIDLLRQGKAYPCFCTPEELKDQHDMQELQKIRTGYYGRFAKWRDASEESVREQLAANTPFTIRFRSEGSESGRIAFEDALKGHRELPENDQDIVVMKTEGLPTYHFAHVVDDHLMRTTHVLRGDEWFASVPLHLQLFQTMGWQAPTYGHVMPINKMEGSSKRKLSKRKDPEANVAYYDEQGYPVPAVIEYLLNLANSDFEDWRKANPTVDAREFQLTFQKLQNSNGALFDFTKMDDVSKEWIAKSSIDEFFAEAVAWTTMYDAELTDRMQSDIAYTKKIIGIERHDPATVRKDVAKWSDLRHEMGYFFDDFFTAESAHLSESLVKTMEKKEAQRVVAAFLETYQIEDTKEEWIAKIRTVCRELGYAETAKEFKLKPESFAGSIANVTGVLRILLTGRTFSPDLYEVMRVMGIERLRQRLMAIT